MQTLTNKLKKLNYLLISIFAGFMLLAPAIASAQADTGNLCKGADLQLGADTTPCQTTDSKGNPITAPDRATQLIADAINLISVVAGVIAVIMVIYGGFRFVTSGGNPESTKSARNTILYALLGLVIVAFAQLIVKFVLKKIG